MRGDRKTVEGVMFVSSFDVCFCLEMGGESACLEISWLEGVLCTLLSDILLLEIRMPFGEINSSEGGV